MGRDDEILEALTGVYGLPTTGIVERFGSSNNANLRLAAAERGDVVARIYAPGVRLDRIRAIQRARVALHDAGLPYLRPLPTRAGDTIAKLSDGSTLELENFVVGEDMNSPDEIVLASPLLGRTHSILARHQTNYAGRCPTSANHVAGYAVVPLTEQLVKRAGRWSDPELVTLAEHSRELAQLVAKAEADLTPGHYQVVHGDFWNNNVLFDGGRVKAVLDLDFMGWRPRIDDLALTLYYTRADHLGGLDQTERLRWIGSIVAAYDSGLDEPLTSEERRALPFALARTILYGVRYIAADMNDDSAMDRLRGDARDVKWSLELARSPAEWHEAFS